MTTRLSAPALTTAMVMLVCALILLKSAPAPTVNVDGLAWVANIQAQADATQSEVGAAHLPIPLRSKLGPVRQTSDNNSTWMWTELPETLDGRVRLFGPRGTNQAGWTMLEAPAAPRMAFADGVLYSTAQYDVIHRVEKKKLSEFIHVRERQGVRTWRWKLHAETPDFKIHLDKYGRVLLGGGHRLEAPKLLRVDGSALPVAAKWTLKGNVLSLRVDDRNLPLPYVIDPDATAPTLVFDRWSESSPYAYIDKAVNADAVWVNTNQAGSVTVDMVAVDTDTGVKHVSFPGLGANWSPGASNVVGTQEQGLLAEFWDGADQATYASASNFSGTYGFQRDDPFSHSLASGVEPFPTFGADNTFSARWSGELYLPENGIYYFSMRKIDAGRMAVDGVEVIRRWTHQNAQTYYQCAGGMNVTGAPKWVNFTIEMAKEAQGSYMEPRWRIPSQAGTYSAPGGCFISPPSHNYATAPGAPAYPTIPGANFRTPTSTFRQTYSWTPGPGTADPGVVSATATNNEDDGPEDTSAGTNFEVIADDAGPTGGSLVMQYQGWSDRNNVQITVNNVTDALTGVASRRIDRRQGVPDGVGGCTLGGGWTTVGAWAVNLNASYTFTHSVAEGDCWEYQFVVTDNVGNETIYQDTTGGPPWFGEDRTNPTLSLASPVWTEGTNPEYQFIHATVPSFIWFNGNQSGDMTVHVNAADASSGLKEVQFGAPIAGAGWNAAGVDSSAPYEYTYAWTAGADDPDVTVGNEIATALDWVTEPGANTRQVSYRMRRDRGYPLGTDVNPSSTALWHTTSTLNVTHSDGTDPVGPGDISAVGIDTTTDEGYSLMRMETDIVGGVCSPAVPTVWDPMAPGAVTILPSFFSNAGAGYADATVQNGKCYRYFSNVNDRVGNESVIDAGVNSTRVDLDDPTGTISTTSPAASGYISGTVNGFNGTMADATSGPNRALNIRWVEQANPGNTGILCADRPATTGIWTCGTNWATAALPDGLYDIVVSCRDWALRTVTVCATRTVTVDNSGPVVTFNGFTNLTGITHVDANTMYYKPGTAGTVTVNYDATDSVSGVVNMSFPSMVSAGWSPGAGIDSGVTPYEYTYSWTNVAVAPSPVGMKNASATNFAGVTTPSPFRLVPDAAGPVPGTISVTTTPAPLGGWVTDTDPTLEYAGWTDPGSGLNSYQWQRRETNTLGFTCEAANWTSYIDHGPLNPGTPWDDSGLADNMCYQYRLVVTDNVTNATTSAPSTTIMVDLQDPDGTIDAAPIDPWAGTIAVAGTSSDPGGRYAQYFTLRYENGGPSTDICTNAATGGAGNWTCNWNTALLPDGMYTIHLDVVDHAGNVTFDADMRTVQLDNTGPSLTFNALVEGTNTQFQHIVGDNIFIKTDAALGGSFSVRMDASDPNSVANVGFPDLDGGLALWTPGAGADLVGSPFYEYTYTWANGAADPGPQTVTATDVPGASSTMSNAFTVTRDVDGPPDADMDYPDGYQVAVPLTYTEGTDLGSGVATWQIERNEAPLAAGICGGWVGWNDYGVADPSGPLSDTTVAVPNCYQYRLRVTDNVGNVDYYGSPNIVKVDDPGVLITEGGGTTNVTEGGASDSYNVELNMPPASDVTITLGPNGQVDTNGVPTLTFTPLNWNVPQAVTVNAINDDIDEGAHAGLITHTSASADLGFNGIVIGSVTPNITDNDTAGFDYVESSGSTMLFEGGAGDDIDVRLTSEPIADVTLNLAIDAQGTISPALITFTPLNWNVYQTITLGAFNDAIAEGAHITNMTPTVVSADPKYDGGGPAPPVPVDITDNDFAGFTVTETLASTDVAEGGATDSFDIQLTSQPASNVTVTLTNDGQVNTSVPSIVFTPINWNIAVPVTVTAVDDQVDELTPHAGAVNFAVSSLDGQYNPLTIPSIPVDVDDNDTAGIVVVENGGTTVLTEGSVVTDSYTVVLATQPTSNVSVALGTVDGQTTATPSPLVFTPVNWATAQTVTVAVVDDPITEASPHPGVITHAVTSADGMYNGFAMADVTAQITDDDIPGITVSKSSVNVTEGGANETYTMVLDSQPTNDVTITLSDGADADATPTTLTFTSVNFATPQTVTVDAVNDFLFEGPHTDAVAHAVASVDPNYNGFVVADVDVNVTDNDVVGVAATHTGPSTDINEAGATSDSINVVLTSQPYDDVTVTIAGDADGSVLPLSLTFTPANWNISQPAAVTAVDDFFAEGAHTATVGFVVSSVTDTDYDGLVVGDLTANVTDNDTASVQVSEPAGSTDIAELGATDTINVVLTSQPSADVTVTVAGDVDAGVAPTSIVFTSVNWAIAVPVTVTAVDDFIDEGPHTATISMTVASADAMYNAYAVSDVTANVTDNDTAGVNVTETLGSTDATEGGATDTVNVVLNSQPTAAVTVTLTPDSQSLAAPSPLTFTPGNWNVAQPVTITAVNDAIYEGPHTSTIVTTFSSADGLYNGTVAPNGTVNITDNDVVGITLTEVSGTSDLVEGGTTDTYSLVLTSEPLFDVNVTVGDDAQGSAAPAVVTFTSANWNVAQSVTMTATDDAVVEGPHQTTYTNLVTSADPSYNAFAVADVIADITDNDFPGVTVTENSWGTNVDESGPSTDTVDVRLTSQPVADVTVTLDTSDGQTTTDVATLTFTTVNWATIQTVTITAVDDPWDEGDPHSGLVATTTTSADPVYNNIATDDVNVVITENDWAGIRGTEDGSTTDLVEGGATDTGEISLRSQPTADVTVTIANDGQATASVSTLTFTTVNWATPQPVTMTAVDDAVAEGPHMATATISSTSVDPKYNNTSIPWNMNVGDNDNAAITMTETAGSTDIAEGGATDQISFVLTSEPTADVVIDVTDDADSNAAPVQLTFTSINWAVAQNVTVTAFDDPIAEGPHTSDLSFAVSSADPMYSPLTLSNVTANVTDNDNAGVTIAETSGSTDVTEGGATDTYDVVLTSQPASDVTVNLAVGTQATLSSSALTFTSVNWNVVQSVTVTAVNDFVAEGAHTDTATASTVSGDAQYNGLVPTPVTINITDNDNAGITVTESSGSSDIVEGGATDSYSYVLTSIPSANVDITIAGDVDGTPSPTTITFTPANWNVAQNVTMTAVDDLIVEGAHTATFTQSVASGDGAYNVLTLADVVANVADNDIPGVLVTESLGTTAVTEGGLGDDYNLVLGSQPTNDVTITIATIDGQTVTGSPTYTFTPLNWNIAQNVTVDAVNDPDDELDPHAGLIQMSASSADLVYNGISVNDVNVQITDNDTAGITVSQTGGTTDLDETGPTTDTFNVVLDTRPTSDVTINIATADGQTTSDFATLTFTSVTWATPQTVTLTAVNDDVDEANPHVGVVTMGVATLDANYSPLTVPDLNANIADNDTAGVLITETSGNTSVDETGPTTDTFTVELQSEPTADVTVTLGPDAQITAVPSPLTFTAADWDTPQTVTVTAVDDSFDEANPHPGTITAALASADLSYNALAVPDVVASVADNDTAGITVTQTLASTDVIENGATDTYTVVLDSKPLSNVVITLTSDAQISTGVPTLTFTPLNWNTAQTVTVTAVNDDIDEAEPHPGIIQSTVFSLDGNYSPLTMADITVNVSDDDDAGITVSQTSGSTDIDEAGPTNDAYDVVLDSEPTSDVTITLGPGTQVTTGAATLTFTSLNWDTPQTVVVTAVDDLIAEASPHLGTITHAVTSADAAYNAMPVSDVTANITDNDFPDVIITESGGSNDATEGGAVDSMGVVLNSMPTADVTVTFTSPDGQATTTPTFITFTSADWNVVQPVGIGAFDDAVDEASPHPGTLSTAVTSADGSYNGFVVSDRTVNITDNDTAGVTVVESSGSTAITEVGATSDDFTVVLTSQPTNDVTVTVGTADGQTTATSTLTFTSGNWNVAQQVTVTAVDDQVDETDPHTGDVTMALTSADANYNAFAVADVVATIGDNDTSGITVTETGTTDVDETGPTADTFDVVLDTQPTANVTITVGTADGQTTVGASTLTFTPVTWAAPQTVTVTAVDDPVDEISPHAGAVTLNPSSVDTAYAAVVVPDVAVNITDNDTAAVVITDTLGSTDVIEGGLGDTYNVVLATKPSADVTITLAPDAQVTTGAATLTFTTLNWATPQAVSINAFNDLIDEASPHPGLVGHAVASADLNYSGLAAPDVTANVTDNDVAGVTITELGGSSTDVSEDGTTDTYEVVLDTEPTVDVTINLSPDAQITTGVAFLTFTPVNWATPQVVTVTAVNDVTAEATPHPGVIAHSTATLDPAYTLVTPGSVTANITDNDVIGITVAPTGGSSSVAEAGTTSDQIDVTLDTAPIADVTITLATPDGQTTVGAPTLTFTSLNWNVPQAITVTAVDDAIDETDPHTGALEFVVTSADPAYNNFVVADQSISIADNDTVGINVTETSGNTTLDETGPTTDTFSVVLASQPTADVTLTFGVADGQTTTDLPSITFTSLNWNLAQVVTVTAVNDVIDEADPHPGLVTTAVSSADPGYSPLTVADIAASIVDNDVAGVTISPLTGPATEGGLGYNFDVVLDTKPTADVTVTLSPDAQVAVGSPTLTFTPLNWSTPQSVALTAVNDDIAEITTHPGVVSFTSASADTFYTGLTITDTVADITDNDVASVVVAPTALSNDVIEGGLGDSYSVVLTSQPTASVTVTLAPDAQVTTGVPTLTFTALNWSTPQFVTINAVDDSVDETDPHAGLVAHTSASADPMYAGLVIPDANINVTDNDTAGITVTESSASTEVIEGGAGDSYQVVLNTQPTSDVTITLAADPQVTTNVPTITFTSVNWNVAQTVNVDAVNDVIVEANPHPGVVGQTVGSLDAIYAALTMADINVSVTDNDTPGITVTPTLGSSDVAEAGATSDTIDVVLESQPTADVVLTLGTADGQTTVGAPTVTFTSVNWNVVQQITVTAVNDDVDEADPHTGTLTFAVASADPFYSPLTVVDETINISDNDTAGISLTETLGSTDVDEAGPTSDAVNIVLQSQPTADVVITVTDDADVNSAPATVTFTSADWSTPQAVTITAFDDMIAEGPHTGTTSFAVGSADPNYSPLTLSPVAANVTDNDTANIVVSESVGSTDVNEAGATSDDVDVVLATEPTADVVITLSPDAQISAGVPSLTFTPLTWNTVQTINVSAVDDFVAEATPHPGVLGFTVTSADAMYNAFAVPSVTANITDNDVVGITVTQSAVTTDVVEGGATDVYDVVLTSQPTAPVTITLGPDAQVSTGVGALTFTAADWNLAQTVTVTAVDDDIDEAEPHPGNVTHVVTSADAAYNGFVVGDVNVNVSDNDTAGVTLTETAPSTDVTEGAATDTYDVVLNTEPTADVTITLSADAQLTAGVGSLTFTPLNWNLAQSVTVSAFDDLIVEASPHPGVIAHAATSLDPNYNALPVGDINANVTDNDIPDVIVSPTVGSNDVVEGGASDTFEIVLDSMPTADVVVNLTGSQVSTVTPTVTFTSLNWSLPQIVTVDAIDDLVDESDPHPGAISFAITSGDPFYNAWPEPDQAFNVTDNDTAGFTVLPTVGSTDVAEGGGGDDFTVVLNTEPAADVTINFTPNPQVTTGAASATFTSATWNTPQTITIDAFDDLVAEGLHNGLVSFAATSADSFYNGLTQPNLSANITDNDTPGLIVNNGGSIDVVEGGADDALQVRLMSEPTADVTVTFNSLGGQTLAAPVSLTFTSLTWNVDQMVTISAVNDAVAEGPHGDSVDLVVTSADSFYNALLTVPEAVNIADNDSAGITKTESGLSTDVTEGGATDSYDLVLTSQPTADVVITLGPDAQVTTGAPTVTFTSVTWNTPQSIVVTGADDSIDETSPHPGVITHVVASADPNYAPITIVDTTANVTDNDTAGVTISETSSSTDVMEGGATDTYTVVLDTQPTADVTFTPAPDSQIGPIGPLTFTSGNWNVAQSVTVTADDDFAAEASPHPGVVSHATTSVDPFYNGLTPAPITANITDNDTVDVIVQQSSGTTEATEGGAGDSLDIRLDSMPSADVTITFGGSQTFTTPASITFTSANWNIPQPVGVDAFNDAIDESSPHPGTVTFTVGSADLGYNGFVVSDVPVVITDNDTAGINVVESGTTDVDEAGPTTDTYDVVLTSEPTADVVITTATADGQTTVDMPTLTFTAADWSVAQTVTVTAVDDAVDEASPHTGLITHTVASADSIYSAEAAASVSASITDNDTAGILLSHSGGSSDVTEGGATDTVEVVLQSQPTSDVTVAISVGSDLVVDAPSPATLTFTAVNWNVAQVATISADDDQTVEGPHTDTVDAASTSSDPSYAPLSAAQLTANITDNDNASVTVSESLGSSDVTEGGATDVLDVVLDKQPLQDVTVTLTPDAQVSAAPVSVTFTNANWSTPQQVTLSAADDPVIEGAHTGQYTFATTSLDAAWAGLAIPAVTANITDNDVASIVVAETSGSTDVAEGGAGDTIDVTLAAQPTADVTVTLTPDAQVSVGSPSLTFTSANWNVPQSVTVDAAVDFVAEGSPHTGSVAFASTSADANFNGLTNGITVNITDDEVAGLDIVESSSTTDVAEGGLGDDYLVKLTSEPSADVTVTFTPDSQVNVGSATLTFTNANWNIQQLVTVSAVDDDVDEDPHTGAIAHALTSADPSYNLAGPVVTANVSDNDTAGVTVTPSGGPVDISVTEAGLTATYDVQLQSEPTSDVVVTLAPGTQLATSVPTLTFTALNWNLAQTVTVSAVNDGVDETDPHPGTVMHSAASADAKYNGGAVTISDVIASISDDDTAGITVTESTGTTDVDEAGATSDAYYIVLDSEPTSDVTITIASDADTTLSTTTLTFTPANWSVAQGVNVTAVDDALIEPTPHTSTITHVIGTLDALYGPMTIADISANVSDNDAAGVTITPTSGSNDVTEGAPGVTDTFDVVLTAEPTAAVTITLGPDAQVGVDLTMLTFTPATWNVPQTVTINANDDGAVEAPHPASAITVAVASPDADFNAFVVPDIAVNVTDNDIPGVTVTPVGGTNDVDETGPTTDTFDVVLDAQPTLDVVLTLATADGETTTSVPSLTFTSANWNLPQSVTVTAVDDVVAEPNPHTGLVTFSVASGDAGFAALTVPDQTVTITDNDTAGLTITPNGLGTTADESAMTSDTYAVELDSEPASNVTVAVNPDGQLTATPATLTFTPANWNVQQDVTVNAVDDAVAEGTPHSGAVSHAITSADPMYNGLLASSETVSITDNDTAGISATLAPSSAVTEGGTVTWQFKSDSQPTANIDIVLTSDAQTSVSAPTVTLTPADYDETVTITATDDGFAEASPHPGVVSLVATTADATYNALIPTVRTTTFQDATLDITDNDVAGVSVTPTSVAVTEGGASDMVSVVLDSQPTADVTVNVTSGTQLDVPVSSQSLTFTGANWSTPQTINVSAVDDGIAEGTHAGALQFTLTSADSVYNAFVVPDVAAAITDNDVAAVLVDESSGSTEVTEGSTQDDTFTVRLGSEPAQPVTINLTPNAQVGITPATLTFTAGNYATPQSVTVSDVDDDFAEASPHDGDIVFAIVSTDPVYGIAAPPATIVTKVTDNDQSGVVITETDGGTAVTEDGATDTYKVKLKSRPIADVSLAIDGAGQATGTPATLTFTDANWSVDQTVTASAVNDLIDEDDTHAATLTHAGTSTDPNYGGQSTPLALNITDNDTASVVVDAADGIKVEEGAKAPSAYESDSITVKLATKPKAGSVIIKMAPGDELTAAPTELTFTAGNFDTAQTVKISAVDDEEIEGDHAGRLEMSLSAADDPIFATKTITGLDAEITDNDSDPDVTDDDEEPTEETPTEEPVAPVTPTTATDDDNNDRNTVDPLSGDEGDPSTAELPGGDGSKDDEAKDAKDKQLSNTTEGKGEKSDEKKNPKNIFDNLGEAFDNNLARLAAALAPLLLLLTVMGLMARDPTRSAAGGASAAAGKAASKGPKGAGGKRRKPKDVGKRRSGKIPKGGKKPRGGKGDKPDK